MINLGFSRNFVFRYGLFLYYVALFFSVLIFSHCPELPLFFCSHCHSRGISYHVNFLKLKLMVWSVYSVSIHLLITVLKLILEKAINIFGTGFT